MTGCGEKVPLPHAKTDYNITYTGDLRIGEVIQFQTDAPSTSTFQWSFGDGQTSIEPSPKHIYYRPAAKGATIVEDTVTVIIDNDIYHPNKITLLLTPPVPKVTGTRTWKGGFFSLHANCCPGLNDHSLNDTLFNVINVNPSTVRSWGVNLPYLADSNYFSNERSVGRYNATYVQYTKDTIFFWQRSGTDTGWAEVRYHYKF